MKILMNCVLPFGLAHGGHAVQIQQTMSALQQIGVAVEPLRWWEESQTGDVIHFVGRMPAEHIYFAHQKNIKVVMSELLTGPGSRAAWQLQFQRLVVRFLSTAMPRNFVAAFNWDSYRLADALVANTPWEKRLMEFLFDAAPEKTFVVPNGVEEVFFQASTLPRGPWLVCTATITPRKRVLELAQAAVAAQTPLWVIGRAYSDTDPYARKFLVLARENAKWIRYDGPVGGRSELAHIYGAARGFVLLSTQETRSLSAEEAAAAGCPLLLADLPWARETFGNAVQFCSPRASTEATAKALRQFYEAAPRLPASPKPATWTDVAQQFKAIYEQVLACR